MKNGKIPVSKKVDSLNPAEIFAGSTLELHPEVANYMQQNKLGYKWISTVKLGRNGGRNPRGWVPFKVPATLLDKIPSNPFGGETKDYFVVGDLVLATKPLYGPGVTVEQHKRFLRERVERETNGIMDQVDSEGNALFREEKK